MQSTRGRSVVWDPSGTQRFLTGGGSEIRLHERDSSERIRTTSVVTELSGLRSFAWCPETSANPLVAAGVSSGRVLLLRLGEGNDGAGKEGQDATVRPIGQVNVRHSRPVNVTAFAPEQPHLLAVGLEKGRGESVLVYNVERTTSSSAREQPGIRHGGLDREPSQHSRGRASSPAGSSGSANESAPLLTFGVSDFVTSLAFLPGGSASHSSGPLLATAAAGKWVRIFDLRSPPATVTTWTSRAGYGLAANPYNSQQLSSFGEDGVVRLWDLRKPLDPLLSFSEADAGAIPLQKVTNTTPRPLAETSWCSTRPGLFATLEKESSVIRLWDLVDGPGPRLLYSHGNNHETRTNGRTLVDRSADDTLRMPILLEDRRTRPYQHPLISFAFASPPAKRDTIELVGLARDTTSAGSGSQRLEIVSVPDSPVACFLERSLLVTDRLDTSRTFPIPAAEPQDGEEADGRELDGAKPALPTGPSPKTPALQLALSPPDRGRTLSLAGLTSSGIDRNQTPRPSMMLLRQDSAGDLLHSGGPSSSDESGLYNLSTDMSVVLRERVEAGYGSDPMVNANLSEAGVREFWLWVARGQALSSEACTPEYDFRFRGVLRILLGFPSGMTNSSTASSRRSTPSQSPLPTPRSIYGDISRSLRRGEEAQTKHAAYTAACNQLVARRRLENTFAISSSQFAAQRKIALSSCGADWEEGWEQVCNRLAKAGDYEAAARFAFYAGQLEKSMQYLRFCKDEKLRLLSPIVAAYLAQKDSARGAESHYASLCRTLSSDAETPWVRAMFAYLATSDWRELVDEMGLPLRDRVAVALRFLSDSELIPFLQELGDEALSSSDLEAVVLFGLRNDGLNLLSSYVDRTADVQTVALACSFTSPGMIRADMRVTRWVETYRAQLDRLQLYSARATFDSARGRRARATLEQARAAGRTAEANEVAQAIRKTAPPQIMLRCQFCSTVIAPSKGDSESRIHGSGAINRASVCPSCNKQLPACCICLARPSLQAFQTNGPATLAWCQKCRHGGHATHLLAWFEVSRVCAVAGCDCKCNSEQR
ncbi:hypothetical protein JCM10908_007333 [Rhodotorula pacifica]|uniref:Sea4p n=1 Tax=Rhodotorula pacifica TaxID=1495444 RepID=UPI00317EF1AB